MRLDKFLILALNMPKNERKMLLKNNQILVDGEVASSLGQNIDSQLQEILVSGQRMILSTEKYYLMNKPEGVVTAVSDNRKKTVLDLIHPDDKIEGLYPVGRLDRFTSGLLLLTNNGPLGLRMLHPKSHVSKTYEVMVNGCLTDKEVAVFKNGVMIDGNVTCQPATLTIIKSSPFKSIAIVEVTEGKFHQIKKMFLSVGVKVLSLKRIKFAEFNLDEQLQPGEYRKLTNHELSIIKKYLI